jgi:hypothetical protein
MPYLGNVTLGTGSDSLLELVATTSENGSGASVWRARQTSSGDQWAVGWQPLGKPGRGGPNSVSVIQPRPGGSLEAFVIDDKDGAVWHSWQTDPDAGWSDWDLLGNPGGNHAQEPVTLTRLANGRIMAVALADGSVWHVSSPQPEPSAFWPAWTSFGQPGSAAAQAASVATLADNRAEVFAVEEIQGGTVVPGFGLFGTLWHRWQETAGGTAWSRWESLGMPHGKPVSPPTLAENHDGRLELFATTDGGQAWHRALQTPSDPRSWTPWAPLHPTGSQPGAQDLRVARDASGRLVLIGSAGYQLSHTAQTTAGASTWTPWSSLATVPGPAGPKGEEMVAPAIGFNRAGLMEIFAKTPITGELHYLQATASGQVTLGPQTFLLP